jgi:hypothetical protein
MLHRQAGGALQSGLLVLQQRPKPEPMCGLKQEKESASQEIPGDEITIVATASEGDTEQNVASQSSSRESIREKFVSPAFARPCPADCCTSVTSVRKPRSREIAFVPNFGVRGSQPPAHVSKNSFGPIHYSSLAIERSHPRGPPIPSCKADNN